MYYYMKKSVCEIKCCNLNPHPLLLQNTALLFNRALISSRCCLVHYNCVDYYGEETGLSDLED